MWSDHVVVVLPKRQNLARMGERREQRLVQALIAQPTKEGFDERVLLRLAWSDVMPLDPRLLRLAQNRPAGQLGAIVRDANRRPPTDGDDRIELAYAPLARQRCIGDQRQAFPRKVVDHGKDAEATAISQRIRLEIQAPALIGSLGIAIGALVPKARLRPPRRRTCSPSSR